jgi:hypothetical protein
MPKLESDFQGDLIKEIKEIFPGAIVLKNDSGAQQGIPDLTVFWYERYAILEVKRSASEPYRPNQEWFLEKFGEWTFSATIFPENKVEILRALEQDFAPRKY